MTIRVVLVDDQALIRAGFRAIIDSADDLEVVGEADDGADAIDVIRGARADVVVEAVGGTAPTFGDALKIVAPGGEVIGLGLFDVVQSYHRHACAAIL